MTVESIITISLGAVGIILAPFVYIYKSLVKRVEQLETKLDSKITEEEVRTLLSDKLDPMKEDLQEVKDLLNKILEIQIKNKN